MKNVATKCSKPILAILMLTNISFAQDFNGIAEDLNSSTTIIDDSRLKLEAELLLKEAIVLSIDKLKEFNAVTGLDSEYGHLTAIPVAAAVMYLNYIVSPASLKAVNLVTPTNAKMIAYLSEFRDLNKKIKAAKLEYKNAKDAYEMAKKMNDEGLIKLTLADLENMDKNLSHAIVQKSKHLSTRPGALYGLGRTIRGIAKSTIILGSSIVTFGVMNDVMLLWIPWYEDLFYHPMKADVEQLTQVLYPDVQ